MTRIKLKPSTSYKFVTYSLRDAKLRSLLSWYDKNLLSWYEYKQQKQKCELPTTHQQQQLLTQLRLRPSDITKLRYSEKNALIDALATAKMSWRRNHKQKTKTKKVVDKRQQTITKFFKLNHTTVPN
eukprot:scaffold33607_cov84-Skeletonema_dohrnii-CCMP3373.AAC.5